MTDYSEARLQMMGAAILRRPAVLVNPMHHLDMATLAQRMEQVMRESGGVGLAAPQIGIGLRAILFEVPPHRMPPDNNESLPEGLTFLINPEITQLDSTLEDGLEGCLSVPGLRGIVPRPRRISYRGIGLNGEVIAREASGFHARVVLHEVDHLDGVLYLDRVASMRDVAHIDMLPQFISERLEQDS